VTARGLVEYDDPDPGAVAAITDRVMLLAAGGRALPVAVGPVQRHRGVTVEANYDVGEYDVSILSATESDGLVNWLTDNGYNIPTGADAVLGSYIKQKMRFFVAKVNLDRMALIGKGYLR